MLHSSKYMASNVFPLVTPILSCVLRWDSELCRQAWDARRHGSARFYADYCDIQTTAIILKALNGGLTTKPGFDFTS
jgi:hypothetical protein